MRARVLQELMTYCRSKERITGHRVRGLPGRPTQDVAGSGTGDPNAQTAMAFLEPPSAVRQMKCWVWAIEQAYSMLQRRHPERARLMIRLFGLDGRPSAMVLPGWRSRLEEEFHISEPTIYRWREDIIQAVMVGAIQAGVLQPYETKYKKVS